MPTIEISWEQARMLGIAHCTCGHPKNNHFDHGMKPCAHCPCKKLEERINLPKPRKQ